MVAGNIMITGGCNLKCPYCFASDLSETTKNHIAFDNFVKATEFILKDNSEGHIGLVGGEPTIHPEFKRIISYLIQDDFVNNVDLFTNGILLDKYYDELNNEKMYVLINVNSPSIIGQNNYEKIVNNLEIYMSSGIEDHIGLGINLYGANCRYNYIIELLEKFEMKSVRVSVTVPDFSTQLIDSFTFFNEKKEMTLNLCSELLDRGITPYFDCNKIPYCMLKDDEKKFVERFSNSKESWNALQKSTLFNRLDRCDPSVVIDQELHAVRCFGISDLSKVDIRNYTTIHDLINYYETTYDCDAFNISLHDECDSCEQRLSKECMGGCLAYRYR